MPNLMITYRCNLRCAYCFANSYVNRWDTDMTLETAGRMLDWLKAGNEKMVGIMGGEPTVHPQLDDILKMVAEREMRCSIFTNGLELLKHLDIVSAIGARLLINVNEPHILGKKSVEHLEATLEALDKRGMMPRVTFGVNIYHTDYDFSYHLSLLKQYSQHEMRVSVAVPNKPSSRMYVLSSLRAYVPDVVRLYQELAAIDAFPSFDCNRLPTCLLREEVRKALVAPMDVTCRSNLWEGAVPCQPVIDILPDETAIRCFGLSDESRVRVADFQKPSHLRRHYLAYIDALGMFAPPSDTCCNCYEHKTGLCQGGCLVYRMDKIMSKRNTVWVKGGKLE